MPQLIYKGKVDILIEFQQSKQDFRKKVPVRLRIGETDLLSTQSSKEGFPMWVHIFISQSMCCLIYIKKCKKVVLGLDDFYSVLKMALEDSKICIYSEIVDKTIEVEYSFLLQAWTFLGQEIKKIVLEQQPEMDSYYGWKVFEDEPEKFAKDFFSGKFSDFEDQDYLWRDED